MKKTTIIISFIVLISAIWLAFLTNKKYTFHEISPKDSIYINNLNDRYFSADQAARAIIENDPSVIFVDIRSNKEYMDFSLHGAMNIPYDSLLNEKYRSYLDQDSYDVVLFSNGNYLADQAWIILHKLGLSGTKVLKGGLNKWTETIMIPEKPDELAGMKEWEEYERRKSASSYFGGGNSVSEEKISNDSPKITIVKKKKSGGNVGGCE